MTVSSYASGSCRIHKLVDTAVRKIQHAGQSNDRKPQSFADRDSRIVEVVHDLRNALATISYLSEIVLLDVPEECSAGGAVREIKAACAHASDLCGRVLDDPCPAVSDVERIDLSTFIASLEPLIAASLPANAALALKPTPDAFVIASPCGLRQLVLNLVKNAGEACSNFAGRVVIGIGVTEDDDHEKIQLPLDRPPVKKRCSYLEVSDNGCGMDEGTQSHLFEGHFTTKVTGHGLGMASIRRIVDDCGGLVQVQSRIGEGTRIRVSFPTADVLGDTVRVSERLSSRNTPIDFLREDTDDRLNPEHLTVAPHAPVRRIPARSYTSSLRAFATLKDRIG